MRKTTRSLALAAMLTALSAALLCLGGIVPLATYLSPILASVAVLAAREECPLRYAVVCYGAAAILGLLLSADKESALLFAFLGYYPLLKPKLDKLPRLLRIVCKLAVFTAAVGGMYAMLLFVFRLEAVVRDFTESAPWLLWSTLFLGVALFLVYDFALDRFLSIYRARRKK